MPSSSPRSFRVSFKIENKFVYLQEIMYFILILDFQENFHNNVIFYIFLKKFSPEEKFEIFNKISTIL